MEPERCPSMGKVPTEMPDGYNLGSVHPTGYPDDAVAQCRRQPHPQGLHWTCLPLASAAGSFHWTWE